MALAQITPAEAAAELLARRRARSNLLDFTRYTFPEFKFNWHHALICKYLDMFAEGRIKRLIINAPPRHTKSELVSRRLPAYLFGRNPNSRVMAITYGADLAGDLNRDVQRIIDSPEYRRLFPETLLWEKNIRTVADGSYLRNSDKFEIVNHIGSYRSTGVGGGITGMGFNYGIIDDPVKSRAEANSPTVSKATWDWYAGVFYTRQQDTNASILVTMTRWADHDLVGRLLKNAEQGGEKWTVLSLPAIADKDLHSEDPREYGQALWGDQFDLEFLNNVKAQSIFEFEAQYQQRPPSQYGGKFDTANIQVLDDAPECVRVVRFYDLAVTKKTYSDFTAGVKMGLTRDNKIVILDLYHVQKESPEVERDIIQNAHLDGRQVDIRLEAEKAGIIQLQHLLRNPDFNGFTIDAKAPVGDKVVRANPFASRVAAGQVQMVRAKWNRVFLDELSMFPNGTHDDIVDGCSGAYDMLSTALEVSTYSHNFLYD